MCSSIPQLNTISKESSAKGRTVESAASKCTRFRFSRCEPLFYAETGDINPVRLKTSGSQTLCARTVAAAAIQHEHGARRFASGSRMSQKQEQVEAFDAVADTDLFITKRLKMSCRLQLRQRAGGSGAVSHAQARN